VQETCTRKNLYQIDQHTCKFLVQVTSTCVAGISCLSNFISRCKVLYKSK